MERAECDFGQLPLFALDVHCAFCGKPTNHPFYAVKYNGRSTMQLPFCNEAHANEFYLKKLRGYDGA